MLQYRDQAIWDNDPLKSMNLRSTDEVPAKYRSIFKGIPYFNILQSSVLDEVLYSDKSIVVCAPTGSGKTMLFELAILRLLIKSEQKSQYFSNQKIIYMAPIKALCSQRCQEWQEKFASIGLRCVQLTGDSNTDDLSELQRSNIVLTTPEKWDHTTRRWHTNMSLISQVKLFLIDEVHLLNDESRGATMEAAISRMKTKRAYLSLKGGSSDSQSMRFIGVSATIPNVQDIAQWLSTPDSESTHFSLSDELRPVKLETIVLSYPCYSDSEFKFDMSLNYKLKTVIDNYSSGKPTLVFCSTRKSVEQAANQLARGSNYIASEGHQKLLNQIAGIVRNQKLRDCIMNGVGYHHAGLDSRDRQLVEKGFISGHLLVLISTSTLAMGVNLPAHLVIVKSTSHYVGGVCEEYSQSEITQMIGRAGRPQFDTSAVAVIMTKHVHRNRYQNLVSGRKQIESSLHKHLIEHLNAEIMLGTIPDTSFILEWIRSTFLYIRVMANPAYYGYHERLSTSEIESLLHNLCVSNLDALVSEGLVIVKESCQQKSLQPTIPGRLMAQYCIAFETMKNFIRLPNAPSTKELVVLVANCKEYQDITLRVGERSTLNQLNKNKKGSTIRFPMEGKIKNAPMKVNCLLQTVLGNIPLQDFALQQDITKIFRTAVRVSKCFMELKFQDTMFQSLYNAVKFSQSIKARMWENSPFVCRQLPGIGPVLASALANAGIKSFEDAAKRNPRDIELIVNRNAPFGNNFLDSIRHLPRYDVSVKVLRRRHSSTQLEVRVSMLNVCDLRRKQTASGKHSWVLIIGQTNGSLALKQRLSDAMLIKCDWSTVFEVQSTSDDLVLSVGFCSQDWVGLDVEYRWSSLLQKKMPLTSVSLGEKENCNNGQSKCSVNNERQNRSTATAQKFYTKNDAKKPNSRVSFSSKNISGWDERGVSSKTGHNTSIYEKSSSASTLHSTSNGRTLPNLKDFNDREANSAISMYLSMNKSSGDKASLSTHPSTSSSVKSKIPNTYRPPISLAKSARKRLLFQGAAAFEDDDDDDILPDFDLGLDWNEENIHYAKSSECIKDNTIEMDDGFLINDIDIFNDSFGEQHLCNETSDETPVAKIPRKVSPWNIIADVHAGPGDSKHPLLLNDLNENDTNLSDEIDLTIFDDDMDNDCSMNVGSSVNLSIHNHSINALNPKDLNDFQSKVMPDILQGPHKFQKSHPQNSFYENRAKKRTLTGEAVSNFDIAGSSCTGTQRETKELASSKPVMNASKADIEKANGLLLSILDFFDL